jgi:hypothetical protein
MVGQRCNEPVGAVNKSSLQQQLAPAKRGSAVGRKLAACAGSAPLAIHAHPSGVSQHQLVQEDSPGAIGRWTESDNFI